MTEFKFGNTSMDEIATEQKWWIEGLIPKGAIIGIVAQASSGKSTLADAILMYLVAEKPFLNCGAIEGCDVLIVDQDSQKTGFYNRLKRLSNHLKVQKHQVFIEFCQGFYFDDGSIITALDKYPTAKVILIDAWHTVAGDIDFDKVNHVKKALAKVRYWIEQKGNSEKTIIITHHGTEKEINSADFYMTTNNFSAIAMGSSAFIQNMDGYFIIASPDKSERLEHIYIRPRCKRIMFPDTSPFVVDVVEEVIEEKDMMYLDYACHYSPPQPKIESDIDDYFKSKTEGTIKNIATAMDGMYTETELRQAMRKLESDGKYRHTDHNVNNEYRFSKVDISEIMENGGQ